MFTRLLLGAFLAGGAFGTGAAVLLQSASLQAAPAPHGPSAARDGLAALKAMFRRPAAVPFPADNPFRGWPEARAEIWAYGFREPWRFSFDPVTGDLWVGDVGQDRVEEVSIVRRGENHGWNVYEGMVYQIDLAGTNFDDELKSSESE